MKTRLPALRLVLIVLALLGLGGCASNIRSAGSVLTTRESQESGRLVPQSVFNLTDVICFQVNVTWDPVTTELGQADIQWNWYKDGKMVAHLDNYHAYLKGAPNARFKMQPAASLGLGHFKVECVVDGNAIASAEFDIKGGA